MATNAKAKQVKAVKGMLDLLPSESHKFAYIRSTCLETARLHGFREIRTPVVEPTELFARGVGDTTDIVQKEMYTFTDRGDRSLTMRPEMTAGVMRCALEHGLLGDALPLKASYVASCYRAEKPQAGRYREFFQFGVELLGTESPAADADLISLAAETLDALGIKGVSLELNSIGCPTCRARYHAALVDFFAQRQDELCETCRSRLEKNPMRILDCKSPVCKGIAENAPAMLDYLCEECDTHFTTVKQLLDAMNIAYTVNPRIVRGLDYYSRTVFEFVSDSLGAQSTCCGGGRYDGLAEQLGGAHTPSLGFAMGLERIRLIMEAQGCEFPEPEKTLCYLAPMGEAALVKCAQLAHTLRSEGFAVETDLNSRSVKAQMKYANKIGAQYVVVIGDSEIESGVAKLKNMETGEQTEIALDGGLMDELYNIGINDSFARLSSVVEGFEALEGLSALMGDGEEE